MSLMNLQYWKQSVLLGLAIVAAAGGIRGLGSTNDEITSPSAERFAAMAPPFITNKGQIDQQVAYYTRNKAARVFVTRDGALVYALTPRAADALSGWSLVETFTHGQPKPVADTVPVANASYFIDADPDYWRTQVPMHSQISLGSVWPGITVQLNMQGGDVEKIFTIAPGADLSDIRVRVDGAISLAVTKDGALKLKTGLGDVRLTTPVAWQDIEGVRTHVPVAYVLHDREYGFSLGAHNPDLPVVIDPLLQSTYLGGSADDHPMVMALHPTTGDVYVAGRTLSVNFPGTTGGAQPVIGGGGSDAFIARLSSDLTTLLQTTYLGGSVSQEQVQSLQIHPTSGDVYVAGVTFSNNFPGTTGGAQAAYGGGLRDAFVARLSADLTTLTQATYLGGADQDGGYSVVIHPTNGEVYVAGLTDSINFPATAGGAQPANSSALGNQEAFVARLNANLTTLNQATYYGSFASEDVTNSLAVHPTTGEVYIAGNTDFATTLPGTTGGAQPTYGGGGFDVFVVRFNAALTGIGQATFLGGSDSDAMSTYASGDGVGRTLTIDPGSGEIFIVGNTFSANFPSTAGGAQVARNGIQDGFIARLNANLTAITQATYLGGANGDNISSLLIHPTNGEVYISGSTVFSGFPGTAGGAQSTFGGGVNDGVVARLNAALTALNQSTYLGGSGNEASVAALALHAGTGDVYALSRAPSTNFPVTTGGAQSVNGGGQDAVVARITADLQAVSSGADVAIAIVDAPDPVNVGNNLAYTVTVTNNGPAAATGVSVTDVLPASVTFVSATPSQGSCSGTTTVTCTLGGLANTASATISLIVTPTIAGTLANTASVTSTSTDPNAVNNSATANTTVNATNADLAVGINAVPNPAGVNSALTYTVTITNNGPLNATGVTLTTNLSGSASNFVSITPSQGSCAGTTAAICSMGALANGASASVNVVVTPTAVGSVTLSAAVSATQLDTNAANNNAGLTVNAVNTICSNSVQAFVANVFGPQAAGCSATVGSGTSGGGGGSLGWVSLLGLVLLGLARREIR